MENQEQESPRPESFERKISPEEERRVLLNFMGNMYGETKKIDSNIIGTSTALGNQQHEKIKRQIEQVYSQNRQPVQQVPVVQPVMPVPQIPQPVAQIQQPEVQSNEPNNQLTFNFDNNEKDILFEKINSINLKLDKLSTKLDKLLESKKIQPKKKPVASKKEN